MSDWPNCVLELHCPCSPRMVTLPVQMLLKRGGRSFGTVLAVLRCSKCGGKPAPVYLVAEHHRTLDHGPPSDWAVELVPPATSPRRKEREKPSVD